MIRLGHYIVWLALAALIAGCQSVEDAATAAPRVVEVAVTRIVEVPVEVTRIVEVMTGAETPASSILPGMQVDVRTYSSAATGRSYSVYVALPISYGTPNTSYPTVYVTDGDFYTIPLAVTASQLALGRELPEVITVGIGYGGSAAVLLERRMEDMNAGGAEAFLAFLTEELVPDIDATYATDPANRTLAGHSLGGTFAIYAALNGYQTFNQILASSPSCSTCLDDAQRFAEANDDLPVHLYLSVGETESELVNAVEGLDQAMNSFLFASYESEFAILSGETHLSARPRAFTSGLLWLLNSDAE